MLLGGRFAPVCIGMLQTQVEVIWLLLLLALATAVSDWPLQVPFGESLQATKNVTIELFDELEELSRIVDIAYCVGTAGLGIYKPFLCASRCQDFPHFELVKVRRMVINGVVSGHVANLNRHGIPVHSCRIAAVTLPCPIAHRHLVSSSPFAERIA